MAIHPTAIVSPESAIGEGVEIGPYSIIGPKVVIGDNTVVRPHVVIEGKTEIGKNCQIFQFASIGAPPQDLKFKGEETKILIGDNNIFREFVTIHSATSADEGMTVIGSNNLLMAYCHVAHNCIVGNNIIMANVATLGGHVQVGDYAIISGLSGVHQFTRIGCHAIVGGASAVMRDVPPYCLAVGNHARLYGLNLVGLRRRNFDSETIRSLKQAYRTIFRSGLRLSEAVRRVRETAPDLPDVRTFLSFLEASKRGFCRERGNKGENNETE
ncbi:MAG: acyl-ACP--UDP-N-acetylglucosamine O-acyltransferase [Deltaproteobacteria bacterium]|nr:acyl-ACP--UDP-N-acetylglucosamine O-acyltransferase [Deltaproteobacteria bacterium]